MICLFLIFSIFSTNSKANNDNAVYLQKDERTPFAGILTTFEHSKVIAVRLIERDTYKALSESYEKSMDLYKTNVDLSEKKVNMLLEQNDNLSIQLKNSQSMTDLQKFLMFGLGIITTVGAGLLVHEIAKTSK